MIHKIRKQLSDKRTYYVVLFLITISAMILLSDEVVNQSKDGRAQIVDLDGGEEIPVINSLKTEEELRLESMLSSISGVGENQVMITWKEQDDTISVFSNTKSTKEIQGVIVSAQGANNASVRLSIIDAVTSLYGLSTSNVMVFQLNKY